MNVTLPKPEIGDACGGCGLCCIRRVCSAGSFTLGLVERYGDRVRLRPITPRGSRLRRLLGRRAAGAGVIEALGALEEWAHWRRFGL